MRLATPEINLAKGDISHFDLLQVFTEDIREISPAEVKSAKSACATALECGVSKLDVLASLVRIT